MLLTAFFALSFWAKSFQNNPQIQSIVSLSWAGYLISTSLDQPQPEINQVIGSWVVPKVNTTTGDAYSSMWIGVGGQFDKTLIQVGTEQNYVGGKEIYNAWYEMLPGFAIRIDTMQVSAGDQIFAAISLVNSDTHVWNIRISDLTTGEAFNQNFNYNSTRLSGEWMVERPTVNRQISALADFGTATFTSCQINANGTIGYIGNFSYSQIRMGNNAGTKLVQVSPLTPDGAGFSVSYVTSS